MATTEGMASSTMADTSLPMTAGACSCVPSPSDASLETSVWGSVSEAFSVSSADCSTWLLFAMRSAARFTRPMVPPVTMPNRTAAAAMPAAHLAVWPLR